MLNEWVLVEEMIKNFDFNFLVFVVYEWYVEGNCFDLGVGDLVFVNFLKIKFLVVEVKYEN